MTTTVQPRQGTSGVVLCPQPKVAISGGFRFHEGLQIFQARPSHDRYCVVVHNPFVVETKSFTVYVVCVNP